MNGQPAMTRNLVQQKLRTFWQGPVQLDCLLASHTTLGVGGPAAALVEPTSVLELEQLLRGMAREELPWLVVGRGSNLLVADEGFVGVVILLGPRFAALEDCSAGEDRLVRAAAGCLLPKLASWCAARGLSGVEFGAGIPGTVGGAIYMNAGAWGQEISQVLDSFVVLTASGERLHLRAAEERFTYRRWQGRPGRVVIASGTFRLAPGDPAAIQERCRQWLQERRERQPLAEASAGSFFKNPPGGAAGRLIEQAGLKGLRVGGARISEQHANFLVNEGGATAQDFKELMALVQERVWRRAGIRLEPEVILVGFREPEGND